MTDLPRNEVMVDIVVDSGTIVIDEADAMTDMSPTNTDGTYTADDVILAMKDSGSRQQAISDWDLLNRDDYTIIVQHVRWIEEDGKPKKIVTRAEW